MDSSHVPHRAIASARRDERSRDLRRRRLRARGPAGGGGHQRRPVRLEPARVPRRRSRQPWSVAARPTDPGRDRLARAPPERRDRRRRGLAREPLEDAARARASRASRARASARLDRQPRDDRPRHGRAGRRRDLHRGLDRRVRVPEQELHRGPRGRGRRLRDGLAGREPLRARAHRHGLRHRRQQRRRAGRARRRVVGGRRGRRRAARSARRT